MSVLWKKNVPILGHFSFVVVMKLGSAGGRYNLVVKNQGRRDKTQGGHCIL